VIGPLPRRYQVVLWSVGLLACVAAGAWVALITPLPLVPQYGALLGALIAPLAVRAFSRTLGRGAEAAAYRS
jgi:hypothetical protein